MLENRMFSFIFPRYSLPFPKFTMEMRAFVSGNLWFQFPTISFDFLPRQQISFPEGWFGFSKDIFEGRNQKICDVEKGPPNRQTFLFKSVYLFTYFVASSRESPYDSISSFMISSSEKLCFLNDDTKIFMELILSSATAFSITSHILMSSFCFRNLFYVKRYELEKGLLFADLPL